MSSSVGSSTSSYNYSSKGLSGLVSGMDTESMVKKMLSGTQTKIDRQKQLKQRTEWKQTIYRDVISSINSFKKKYFDSTYDSELENNLSSSSFFNSMVSSVTSGDSVKIVSTNSTAMTSDMKIVVSELASAAKLTSSEQMSGSQTITGTTMDVASIKSTLEAGTDLSFDLTLDGVTKSITFSKDDFDGDITADTIKSVLDTKLSQAFGTYVGVSMTDSKLTFSINIKDGLGNTETGHELNITGANASKFGITPGTSTLISGMTKLSNLTGISGKSFSFTINGEKIELTGEETISSMISKINSSNAGVKIAYSSMTDTFSMESSSTGKQYGISMSQESGNLLSVIFGDSVITAASKASSSYINTSSITGTALSDNYTTKEASMSFKVNGTSYTFNLTEKDTSYTKTEVETALNSWLKTKFGESGGVANISYENGKLNTAAGYLVSFNKTTSTSETDLAYKLGFSANGATNAVSGDTLISDVPALSGLTFNNSSGGTATTLSEIASYTSGANTYDITYLNGRLELSGTGTLDLTGTGIESLFGTTLDLGSGTMEPSKVTAGTDAILKINGVDTSRSSNTFTVDGITLTATKKSATETVIGTTRDVDKIVKAVKSFVTDYNTMVGKLYGYITEDADYKDYTPLTSEQEEEMSEKEIENWNKKAKTGLIRNDSEVSQFLQNMRSAFYKKSADAGIAAYSIGIETTKGDLSGKLTLDETALRSALASDPDAVSKLFTDTEDGLATLLAKACDQTAKLSVASPGTLIQKAGADSWSANAKTNDMYMELKSIKDKLSDLQDKYDDERERYWSKFNTMETIMSNYSAQSAMISQFTS